MEIVAHALWATAAGKAANRRIAKVGIVWSAIWTLLPDLFAFSPEVSLFWVSRRPPPGLPPCRRPDSVPLAPFFVLHRRCFLAPVVIHGSEHSRE